MLGDSRLPNPTPAPPRALSLADWVHPTSRWLRRLDAVTERGQGSEHFPKYISGWNGLKLPMRVPYRSLP